MQKIVKMLSIIVDDALLILGIVLIAYGMFLIYVPAGFITLGAFSILLAYLAAKRKEIS